MRVYRELFIRGNRRALQAFIDELDSIASEGWSRDVEQEAQVRKRALGPMYCYACTPRSGRPASRLWIATKRDESLYVSNILATDFQSLTADQYNAILLDFVHACASAACARIDDVSLNLSEADLHIEDFLTPQTSELLRSFSRLANKAVLHPYDRKRWNEFAAAAYREHSALDVTILKRWLIEEEGWPEDKADSLAMEYENSRELLEVFQSN
jgi:hypothetical protein